MYSLPEAFLTSLRLALFLGIFLAVPFICNGLWGALAPLFSFDARRYSLPVVLAATGLFYGGAFFLLFSRPSGGDQFPRDVWKRKQPAADDRAVEAILRLPWA